MKTDKILLPIAIFFLTLISFSAFAANVDFNVDGDVDGSDLAQFASAFDSEKLSEFADNYGTNAYILKDDFITDTTGEYTLTDTWTSGGTGQFLYDASGERVQVITGNDIGLQFSHALPPSDSGNLSIDFLPTAKYPSGGWITVRLVQDENNYYEVNNTDGYGPDRLVKVVNGQEVISLYFQNEYAQNNIYNILINFSPALTIVEAFGEVLNMSGDSSAIVVSRFEVNVGQQDAYFDNILFTNAPFVRIITPQDYHFQTNNNLLVQTFAGNLEAGWGIKFVLDIATSDEGIILDTTEPFEVTFTNLPKKEHTVDTFVVDDANNEVSGEITSDNKIQVGIGDYYVAFGDSITEGLGDDISLDDISLDGRNSGGGYLPILNDMQTNLKGYPHFIASDGAIGSDSSEATGLIQDVIDTHSEAQYILVLYGTNDSNGSLPIPSGLGLNPGDSGYAGSYKDNMQQIVNAILAAGKEPILAKVPITLGPCSACGPFPNPDEASRNLLIQEYNLVINGLVSSSGITVTPPDFYNFFNSIDPDTGLFRYETQYSDNLHPNGIGYQSMANLWFNALNE